MVPRPKSPYALQKLVGEYYCNIFSGVYGLETVALRYFNVYGPRQDPSSAYSGVLSLFMRAILDRKAPTMFGDGGQSRDFTYISNVVDANLRAAETTRGIGEVINVANGERTTLNQLLDTLKRVTGKTEVEAEYRDVRVGDVRHSLADITRARELLGYEPRVGLEEGLRKTIDWWKQSRFSQKV
jgi:nucleoside-diphosphate-sugar epimerase